MGPHKSPRGFRPWDSRLAEIKLSPPTLRGINRYRAKHGLPPLDEHGRPTTQEAIRAQEVRRERSRQQREINKWWGQHD
jgi:hypothetical protein